MSWPPESADIAQIHRQHGIRRLLHRGDLEDREPPSAARPRALTPSTGCTWTWSEQTVAVIETGMMALAATMPVRALGGVTGNRTIPLKNP